MAIPSDPETLLRRRPAADALTEAGYKTAPATLARKASVGGGPVYRLYGRVPVYRWTDLLDWAQSRMSGPIRSTAELDAARRPDRTDAGSSAAESDTAAPPRRQRARHPDDLNRPSAA